MRSVVLATAIQMAAVLLAVSPVSAGETAGAVYSFPNPARSVPAVTFHAEIPDAVSVQLFVYNVAGELVHQGQLTGDGSNEYRWNLNDVASGNYFLIVRADRNGAADVVARKSFTVLN